MKSFKIKVMSSRRQVIETTISAPDLASARIEAGRLGQVISITRLNDFRWGVMSLTDRLVFFQRLASMLAARVGTSEALDIIYQSFSGMVREAARILKDGVANRGLSLPEAMELAGPRFFPLTIVAIIKTGSAGGDMAYAIREAARFEQELSQVKKESGKGMFSALAGFIVGIITILGSTLYVAPEILSSNFVAAAGGTDIGWVMTIADITTYISVFVAVVVGVMLMFGVVFRPLAPAMVDRVVLKVPYYRDMVLAKTNYMVFFGLAVLLKAGLRVEDALSLSIAGAPKGELRNDLERALAALKDGRSGPWPYSMQMLHPTDKAALATAQDREQTAHTIEELAHQYKLLYRARMETFVPVLQGFSAILLALAGFVLFGVSIIPLMQGSGNILNSL